MSRSCGLALFLVLLASSLFGADQVLWSEYGLTHTDTIHRGKLTVTAYKMKDPTGALAAWEWLRSAKGHPCHLASFCTKEGNKTVLSDGNYVLAITGNPRQSDVDAVIGGLSDHFDTALPPILSFLPRKDIVAGSAKYLLGSASVDAFAPELKGMKIDFENGVEGQVASYIPADGQRLRLVILHYPIPSMAHEQELAASKLPGVIAKRAGVLVAAVLPPAPKEQAENLLAGVQYEKKIVWNDTLLPSPVKSMGSLLLNIIYISCILSALALTAGLIYAGMRIYRRRYGTLEDQESMTTLHLTGK